MLVKEGGGRKREREREITCALLTNQSLRFILQYRNCKNDRSIGSLSAIRCPTLSLLAMPAFSHLSHLCQVYKVSDTFDTFMRKHFHLIHIPVRLHRLEQNASERMP